MTDPAVARFARASYGWREFAGKGGACVLCLWLFLCGGCASVRTLDAAKPGAPIIYSGTRLDWYALQGGCCPLDRFGAEAPTYAGLDLPASVVLDTLLLPFALAAELGFGLGVQGGR